MILVTGCTGYIGSRLCKRLLTSGFRVCGLIKPSEREKAKVLISLGLIPYYGDLTDLYSLRQIPDDIHFIYHLAGVHSAYNNTYNLHMHGTANLVKAFSRKRTVPIIVASNSSVYANTKESHSEDIKPKPDNPFGEITVEMEKIIRKSRVQHTIMRIGEVYGDNEADPFNYMQKGLVLIGNGMNYTSKIHIEDLINILIKCTAEFPQGVFNVCDDELVRQIDFYSYAEELCKIKFVHLKQNIELSERVMLSIHGLRTLDISMNNKKLKDRLDYEFVFPNYKNGLNYLYARAQNPLNQKL